MIKQSSLSWIVAVLAVYELPGWMGRSGIRQPRAWVRETLVVGEMRVDTAPFHRSVLLLTSTYMPLAVAVGASEVLLGHLRVCVTLRHARHQLRRFHCPRVVTHDQANGAQTAYTEALSSPF